VKFEELLLGDAGGPLSTFLPDAWRGEVRGAARAALAPGRHGRLGDWDTILAGLPDAIASDVELHSAAVRIGRAADMDEDGRAALRQALLALHPWRKGPFELFGIDVDAEWRSELKFSRLRGVDFAGARVLDVGCGNGYYALRMLGAGADSVLGVDPGLGHLAQFAALRRYAPELGARLLPLPFEALPPAAAFDVVCSLGVIYHRRSPLDHLDGLLRMLTPGGTLVVESIVIPGPGDAPDAASDIDTILCPPDRYARMRNVWFLPSARLLARWMARLGLEDLRILDEGPTTTAEQRPTEWMRFESLAHALDPEDPGRTVEGHPAPRRAVVVGRRRAA
jgi:tRNA (mo5U34)-methyltransferase